MGRLATLDAAGGQDDFSHQEKYLQIDNKQTVDSP
jgi:hypothetical protein